MFGGRIVAEGNPDELKAANMSGELLEVEADPVIAALDLLLGFKSTVREAALYGNLLHVTVPDAPEAETELSQRLAAGGVKVNRIERIAPTLEDVFVSLIEQERRKRGDR